MPVDITKRALRPGAWITLLSNDHIHWPLSDYSYL